MKTDRIGFRFYLLVLAIFLPGAVVCAQDNSFLIPKPHPAAKMSQRYEIDAKRSGVSPNSEDALPRSREFKRIDNTYYVGWFYEGTYKYEHAADYVGFKNAAAPLEQALKLLERDYRKALTTRTADPMEYIPVINFQVDYTMIAYFLMNCYSNMDDPQKVFELMRKVVRFNFQRDYYMDAYNYMAWTVHRNRFYTSAKYPFLKNSIDENERLAHRYLDSGLRRIAINRRLNETLFPPGYAEQEKQSVYHYKAILHGYAFNIDSTNHYFELMRRGGLFSHNNYATWQAIIGNFDKAYDEYTEAAAQDGGNKHLKEWAYYTSILDIYKSKPKTSIEMMRGMIRATGSTPGFGWYNIGLARALLYDGQVAEAERITNKAAEFKETHIGTTLGQSHYDFSIQLEKLMAKEARWEMQKFENSNWWYNPRVLTNMGRILTEKYAQQFLIINQFSQNPERERVIYKLFSSESTVSWDEVWYLIRDFSTNFFLERFKKEAETTNRVKIRKYFQLFNARLLMKQDKYKEAEQILNTILADKNINQEYEKLFIARMYHALAECAKERKDNAAYKQWAYKLYTTYPQLVPFSGLKMDMNLHVGGTADEAVIERLKECNINWGMSNSSVEAYIIFSTKGKLKRMEYYVLDKAGRYIVPRQSCTYKAPGQSGIDMAYRLFNIGGNPAASIQ
jgi:hypothetical protein